MFVTSGIHHLRAHRPDARFLRALGSLTRDMTASSELIDRKLIDCELIDRPLILSELLHCL